MSHKHKMRSTCAPRARQEHKATNTCTTYPPNIQVTRTCHASISSEPHAHYVNTSSRSVSHVTRSSPGDPHVQPLIFISPSDTHVQHVTTIAFCDCTSNICPTSTTSDKHVHHVSYKHTKRPERAPQLPLPWNLK